MVFLDYRKFSVVCSCSLSVYSFWCWWCNTAPTHSTRTHCICRLLYTKIQYNIIKGYAQRSCYYYCVWYCGTCRRGLNSFTCDPVSTLRLLIIMDFLLFFFVSSFVSRSRRQTILLRMETSQTRDVYVRLFRAPSFGSAAICDAMRRTGWRPCGKRSAHSDDPHRTMEAPFTVQTLIWPAGRGGITGSWAIPYSSFICI